MCPKRYSSNLEALFVLPGVSIREVIGIIDKGRKGIALVVTADQVLLDTITDGDIRRAVLRDLDLTLPVESLFESRKNSPYPQVVTAPDETPEEDLREIMITHSIRHLPLLNKRGQVVDIVILADLALEKEFPVQAVVMAGGKGLRLRPLTDNLPKPMLPVGDQPLMEILVRQLRETGIQRINITTHYLPHKIIEHFGDGKAFGVGIDYVHEDHPLGTAGALRLMSPPNGPLLVINGDILTTVDFRTFLNYHMEHQADLTVGVRQIDLEVPYGVVECDGSRVRRVREKPLLKFLVNAGIYLLEPITYGYIPSTQRFDMPDLIQRLIKSGKRVVSFPIMEYWRDIGQHADYLQAQHDVKQGKLAP